MEIVRQHTTLPPMLRYILRQIAAYWDIYLDKLRNSNLIFCIHESKFLNSSVISLQNESQNCISPVKCRGKFVCRKVDSVKKYFDAVVGRPNAIALAAPRDRGEVAPASLGRDIGAGYPATGRRGEWQAAQRPVSLKSHAGKHLIPCRPPPGMGRILNDEAARQSMAFASSECFQCGPGIGPGPDGGSGRTPTGPNPEMRYAPYHPAGDRRTIR